MSLKYWHNENRTPNLRNVFEAATYPLGGLCVLHFLGYHYLYVVTFHQSASLPASERRNAITAAPFYLVWGACLILAMLPCRSGAPLCGLVLIGSRFPLWGICPRELEGLPTLLIWRTRGIAFKSVPWVRPIATAFAGHLQARNNTC